MPSSPVNPHKLTDEQFYLPGKVEMIIGADLYPYLIRPDGSLVMTIIQSFKKLVLDGFFLGAYQKLRLVIIRRRCT
jgi:hypothetical protein